jgi:hypothetical protein
MAAKTVSEVGLKTGLDINHDGRPDAVQIEVGDHHSGGKTKAGKKVEDFSHYRELKPALGTDDKDLFIPFKGQEICPPKKGARSGGIAWLFKSAALPFYNAQNGQPFFMGQDVLVQGAVHKITGFRVVVDEKDEQVLLSEPEAVFEKCNSVKLSDLKWVGNKGEVIEHFAIQSLAKYLANGTKDPKAARPSATATETLIAEFYSHVAKTCQGSMDRDAVKDVLFKSTQFKPLSDYLSKSQVLWLQDAVLEGAYFFLKGPF